MIAKPFRRRPKMSTRTSVKIKIIALGGLLAIQAIAFSGIGQLGALAAAPSQRPDDPQEVVPDDPNTLKRSSALPT